jgi:carboxymethylenebutenolidase
MKAFVFGAALVLATAVPFAQSAQSAQKPVDDPHADHAMEMQQTGSAMTPMRPVTGQAPGQASQPADIGPRNPNLPPRGDTPGADKNADALAQLKDSPRHADWVDIKSSNGGAPIRSFVVYPERKDKAPVVIVIQEIFGLTDWIRGVTDQLAKEGFIAIAPDFLSGMGPNHGGSQELGEQGATQVIGQLKDADKIRILNDVRAYAMTIPSANGKLGTVGFCWGGGTSFLYALNQPALNAAVSYYGPMSNDPAAFANAKTPILGLYAGNDARVDANIENSKTELAKKNVTYDVHIFEGAGHGYLRAQGGNANAPGNYKATQEAWPLTLAFLRKYTK